MNKDKLDTVMKYISSAFESVSLELAESEYKKADSLSIDEENSVAVIIGIAGTMKGRIILHSGLKTAYGFTKIMNCGDPLDKKEDLFLYMAEFANMICGRSTTYINNEFKERKLWLTPPAIFAGKNLQLVTPTVCSEQLFFSGDKGKFILDVGFEEGKKS